MTTSSSRVRLLVEIALVVALAAVLNSIKLWRMPQGGTFSLGMLPLFVLAVRRGPAVGVAAGALYGIVDFFVDPYPPVHWIQFALDYPLAYAGVGLSGLLSPAVVRARRAGSSSWTAWLLGAVALGAAARYAVHVASGVVFFAEYAQGQPALAYSLGYNLYVPLSAAACYAAALAVIPMLPETEAKTS
ncbi:MAG: energy-coupled thiamine transporter ThiT [Anaerosomatales bacterium]|nr:energy-coupled thiamine transporter ThiT [Anaerosomatales bacterium]